MAMIEKVGMLTHVDASGNKKILYPVTTAEAVVGLEEMVGPKNTTVVATLAASGWADQSTTVAIEGVTAGSTVIVTPAPSCHVAYCEAGVYCVEQADGAMTFNCMDTPVVDLTVNVLIMH